MATKDRKAKQPEVTAVSHSEARRRLSSLVDQAMDGTPVLLEHRGRPTVVLVDAEQYRRRLTSVRPDLTETLRRQFLEENAAAQGPEADEAIEEALFSGSLEAQLPE